MDKIERQKEHFESISEKYYESRQLQSHLLLKDLLWDYFLKNKNYLKKDNLRVLEPMCGYGEGKDILEKHLGIKILYSGFDYSTNLVKKINTIDQAADVIEMDITKFVPSIEYDLIIIIGGLHHVPFHVDSVLDKFHESLCKNGHLIYFEPTHNNFLFKKIRERIYRKNPFFDDDTERAFELKQINQIFLNHKFKIIDQIYPGLLSYNPDAFPFFNKGGEGLLKALFGFDKLFFRNFIGKKLSFATITLLQKNNE
jgi:SAM-dependent methyltransferase